VGERTSERGEREEETDQQGERERKSLRGWIERERGECARGYVIWNQLQN
jgi:hypothetical protein